MELQCGEVYARCLPRRSAVACRGTFDYLGTQERDLKDLEMTLTRWPSESPPDDEPWPHPPLLFAIGRGLSGCCPACGKANLFNGFLRVVQQCTNCAAPLGLARADDAPPYFTILITGHIVIPLMFVVDRLDQPPIWVMAAIFVPLTFCMALGLLRPVKGATVGLMLTLHMLKSDTDPG